MQLFHLNSITELLRYGKIFFFLHFRLERGVVQCGQGRNQSPMHLSVVWFYFMDNKISVYYFTLKEANSYIHVSWQTGDINK